MPKKKEEYNHLFYIDQNLPPNIHRKYAPITVVDSIMGSGKTVTAIKEMNKTRKVVYVTPFLSEVDRVLANVKEAVTPEDFRNNSGKNHKASKITDLKRIIDGGHNKIVITHSLFMLIPSRDMENLFSDYVLILDEVITPVEVLNIKRDDIKMLLESNRISTIGEDHKVVINYENFNRYDPYLNKGLKTLIKKTEEGEVFVYGDAEKGILQIFVWEFSLSIFQSFKDIYVLTYLFKGTYMEAFFLKYGIDRKVIHNDKEGITDDKIREKYKSLITVLDGKFNDFAKGKYALSKKNIDKMNKESKTSLGYKMKNIINRETKLKTSELIWTTYKGEGKRKGRIYVYLHEEISASGYKTNFVPINSRATNIYREKKGAIYLANRYPNPVITNFFFVGINEVLLDIDLWALGEMLQWLWRSCIRDNNEVTFWIPSKRMRKLFIQWLDGKEFKGHKKELSINAKILDSGLPVKPNFKKRKIIWYEN